MILAAFRVRSFRFQWPADLLTSWAFEVQSLAVYGLPIGLMLSGALIERIGYPLTITVSSAIGLACTLLIGIRWRDSIWRATRPSPAAMSVPQRL